MAVVNTDMETPDPAKAKSFHNRIVSALRGNFPGVEIANANSAGEPLCLKNVIQNIELYKDNDKEAVMTCNDKSYSRNSDNILVCNSSVWEMAHKSTETEKFKIKVTFPSEYNSYDYAELVDYIDISISSWQKIE